jgi:hypothetical protein
MESIGISRNPRGQQNLLLQPYGEARTMTTSITGLNAFIESELHSGNCAPYTVRISKSKSAQRWYVSTFSVTLSGVTYSIKVRPTTDDDTGLKLLREPTWSPDKDGKTIIE